MKKKDNENLAEVAEEIKTEAEAAEAVAEEVKTEAAETAEAAEAIAPVTEKVAEEKAPKKRMTRAERHAAKSAKNPSKFRVWLNRFINLERRAALEGYFFTLPLTIGLLAFFAFPLILSIVLSFSKLDMIVGLKMSFIGFDNYIDVVINDVRFTRALTDILSGTFVKIPLIIIFSLLLAIIISRNIKFKGFFRVVFFLPFILGTGYVLEQLYSLGAVTNALSINSSSLIPPSVIAYLGGDFTKMVNDFLSIIVSVLWSCSVQILMFLSGLQSISPSLYESAGVDGATEWEKFWKITLPMIMPMMVVNIIYSIADSFVSVDNDVLQLIKDMSLAQNQFDKAAAVSWIYTLIILVFVGLVFLFIGRSYGSDTTKGADERAMRKAKKRRYNW